MNALLISSYYAGLLPFPDLNPVAFSLGPISVHWYGLAYVTGIILGWYYARQLIVRSDLWPQGRPPMTLQQTDDFVTWATLGVVIGGRIGYLAVYDLPNLFEDPMRAFRIWNGGMSFHGGFLGTALVMLIYARRHTLPLWSLFDLVSIVVPFGLLFGRLANFINGELWGRVTDVPWAIVFPKGGPFARHPSQLYEAGLEGLLLLVILFIVGVGFSGLKKPGLVTGLFVSVYALSRIFVEFFREPDEQIGYLSGGWLTMGMILSLPMLAAGIWAMIRAQRLPRALS
jgi:phosphatidylglycerol---prolipoprotein diacylglyceryl transferase